MEALSNANGESNVTLIHPGFQKVQWIHRHLFKEVQSCHPSGILRIHFFLRSLKLKDLSQDSTPQNLFLYSQLSCAQKGHATRPDSHHYWLYMLLHLPECLFLSGL